MDSINRGKWRRKARRAVITAALEAAYVMHRVGMFSEAAGFGVVFTLHHVRPVREYQDFSPNAHLEITPDFLDEAIRQMRQDGYSFVALQDLPELLKNRSRREKFAAFTLDDGYRNNLQYALPVFAHHKVPFTVFVNSGFANRTHSLWWETLERLLARGGEIRFDFGSGVERFDLSSTSAKYGAFDRFSDFIWHSDEETALHAFNALAMQCGIDPLAIADELTLPPAGLRALAGEPLASLGAHTATHRALSRLNDADVQHEMKSSADWIENLTGKRPISIAYPYGSPRSAGIREYRIAEDMGFRVGVTTRPGVLSLKNIATMTGLPRVSLNGFYQKGRYVSAMASGIPFSVKKR